MCSTFRLLGYIVLVYGRERRRYCEVKNNVKTSYLWFIPCVTVGCSRATALHLKTCMDRSQYIILVFNQPPRRTQPGHIPWTGPVSTGDGLGHSCGRNSDFRVAQAVNGGRHHSDRRGLHLYLCPDI